MMQESKIEQAAGQSADRDFVYFLVSLCVFVIVALLSSDNNIFSH